MSSAAALFRASNLLIMDYPFDAALASALAVCDEAVVIVGQSEDATRDWVYALQNEHGRDRVHVQETIFQFDLGWQERWWNEAQALTRAEWLWFIDADELVHEDHHDRVRQALASEADLINVRFVHLYATDHWQVAQGFLTNNTRLGRRSVDFRMVNLATNGRKASACAMRATLAGEEINAHTYDGPEIVRLAVPILHYGWARFAQALAISQTKHHAWYANGNGLQDGHVPEVPPYRFDLAGMHGAGRLAPYSDTHPALLDDWRQAHRTVWEGLDAELEEVSA